MVKYLKVFLFISALSLIIAFLITPYIFYQQDEYYLFFNCNNLGFPWTKVLGSHFTPFRDWIYCLQYQVFNLAVYPRVVVALFLHITTLVMVYLLLIKLKLNIRRVSILLILLFTGTNVLVSQAYLWLSTYSGTIASILMSLISIYFFIDFLKEFRKYTLFFSYLFLLFALLFKEYALYIFPLYIVLYFLDKKKEEQKIFIKTFIPLIIIYLSIRILLQLHSSPADAHFATDESNFYFSFASLQSYIVFWIISPIQILIPSNLFYDITKLSINDLANQILLHNIQIGIGIILWVLISIFIIKKIRKNEMFRSTIIFCLLIYSSSLIPFTIIVNSVGQLYLESRYYYLISIAFCLVLSAIFSQYRHKKSITYIISVLVILLIINLNYYYTNLINLKKTADVRKQIIASITSDIANKKPMDSLILYINSDAAGYYGLPDVKIPFQTGFGNVLAIHLYDDNVFIDKNYFKNSSALHLYTLPSQGAYKFGNKTYGYFENYNSLSDFIHKNPKMLSAVQSYYWSSNSGLLIDRTNKIRQALSK